VNIHELPRVPRSQLSAPVSTHPDATGTASDRVKVSTKGAAAEAEPGGVVRSKRVEIQVGSDRATGAIVIHQIKQHSFKGGESCNASPFFKIEARPARRLHALLAQVAAGAPCAHAARSPAGRTTTGELDHGASAPQSRL